jgi:hypothetical protein
MARTLLSASRRSPRKISSNNTPGQFLRFRTGRPGVCLRVGYSLRGRPVHTLVESLCLLDPSASLRAGSASAVPTRPVPLAGRSRFLARPRRFAAPGGSE